MSVKSTFCHSFMITRGFVAPQLPPRCHIRHSLLRNSHHAATFGILVALSRHFLPHVGRVNKSGHHSHASMRGGGLLTR